MSYLEEWIKKQKFDNPAVQGIAGKFIEENKPQIRLSNLPVVDSILKEANIQQPEIQSLGQSQEPTKKWYQKPGVASALSGLGTALAVGLTGGDMGQALGYGVMGAGNTMKNIQDNNQLSLSNRRADQNIANIEKQQDFNNNLALQGQDLANKNHDLAVQRQKATEDYQKEQLNLNKGKMENDMLIAEQKRLANEEAKKNIPLLSGDNGKMAMDLRKEANARQKDYYQVGDSYSRILKTAENPSPAGDLSLIFNYMKMLDPGSVVRESEFANAENAKAWFDSSGAPTAVRLAYEKARNGTKLLPEQREDFVNRANQLFDAQALRFDEDYKYYGGLAEKAGLSPNDVIYDPFKSIRGSNTQNTKPKFVKTGTYNGRKVGITESGEPVYID